MLSLLLAVPSCIYSFWHGFFYTCFTNFLSTTVARGEMYLNVRGASLGTTPSFTVLHAKSKVEKWSEELQCLSTIAQTHPQAAYAAFTHGLASKWIYASRTIENIGPLLQPLEDIIRTKFIPAICGRPAPSNELRDLLALPCRMGGLGILNPTHTASHEFSASKEITKPIVRSILSHDCRYTYDSLADQLSAVTVTKREKRDRSASLASELKSHLPPDLQRAMNLSQEKGASNWLTVLPVEEFGFSLHKGAFRDALALRYGWPLHNTPSTCSCGSCFSVEHALSCPKGGYPSIRHNEIRDFTTYLLPQCGCRTTPSTPVWRNHAWCLLHHTRWSQTRHCCRWILGWQV